jgi:hypothetical protein
MIAPIKSSIKLLSFRRFRQVAFPWEAWLFSDAVRSLLKKRPLPQPFKVTVKVLPSNLIRAIAFAMPGDDLKPG